MICRVLPHSVHDGPEQMALDQALLESVSNEPECAVFRTYEWSRPTLSLGYFQKASDATTDPRWRGVPLLRRSTGGGAILHHHELTYALVLPRAHPVSNRIADLYRLVHQGVALAMKSFGVEINRWGDQKLQKAQNRPFLCFTDRDHEDMVIGTAKVLGSAQRRRPGAVLQHGSLLLARSLLTPELPGIAEASSHFFAADACATIITRSILKTLDLDPEPGPPTECEISLARQIKDSTYSNPAWTYKR